MTPTPSETDEALATALAQDAVNAMWSRDQAAQALGMEIRQVLAGSATLRMRVRKDMVNGHQICHGGLIFTLADTAFAYACNSYNQNTVASACHIDFLAPGREGDVLEAVAIERSSAGRTGVYDVEVRVVDGHAVALFRGKSHRIKGEVIASFEPPLTSA
ncbi:MAG: hydroxyphenylacetyl-CoA thioesterase PaaI [Burkholderiaceae bacterium]|jgi:acyl-CoA thioesterase|nr:hydroxyphenylacetyl-CoA thioesterase PaaI [Betaproteobacteria bacterium]MDA8600411.1 hydroxyphenylacetyl-CoA thioesterase PaaI [Burkholderiaceae bacterium]MCH9847460.1 hydroxyphenylacetyl-CoA thioesterase PaaI [Betaproteobacteria bacterium]MDA9884257.1 hydroxyphenylacetyl-CoA thioesterase PaaI [Burkholderiaceae bacterium]MDC0113282.1 hydroxyphenylacetyl-CoA thioesterase PaaI [Burkholderiaceae bacterium]|tara:strand:+ start:321 stop:800 length:480 start_codon:yes stop_codon:yes gene_type:complete